MSSIQKWDVIVVGGGHAGCEAAHAAAKIGAKTLMLTLDPTRIGVMSCNPAMGGLAKGQLVREIDALGGLMGKITDRTAIQYRRLNMSKGPAVRSSRAQCDKELYAKRMQEFLFSFPNLEIRSAEVKEILCEETNKKNSSFPNRKNKKTVGLKVGSGEIYKCASLVITTGTFMCAIMHTGEEKKEGGRLGDADAKDLSKNLSDLGFQLRRLKTGTPPRLKKDSIDFSKTEEQRGDEVIHPFSYYPINERRPELPQISCYITHTNKQVHEIIAKNINRSPIYSGSITGIGPRYCPSIEDKIHRFVDKERHQIFLEPEGLDSNSVYVNGISTSLPKEVQEEFVRKVRGLENAEFLLYGYAVEYDAIDARQLKRTLEAKDVEGLFFAGQVNGTSGYEEAGGQGIIAGINAALRLRVETRAQYGNRNSGSSEFILGRDEAYIGVLIDDLTLKGSDEPYRMFTSRAEHRLWIRDDNADIRLSPRAKEIGMLDDREARMFQDRSTEFTRLHTNLKEFSVFPNENTQNWFKKNDLHPPKDKVSGIELLKRPEFTLKELKELGFSSSFPVETEERVQIHVKYDGYIKRDKEFMSGIQKNDKLRIPTTLDYDQVFGLSNEAKSRLKAIRPETLGQVSRIQGITPASVANLLIHFKKNVKNKAETPKNSMRGG